MLDNVGGYYTLTWILLWIPLIEDSLSNISFEGIH